MQICIFFICLIQRYLLHKTKCKIYQKSTVFQIQPFSDWAHRILFLILIFLFSFKAVVGQKTTLSGNIPNGVNFEISLKTSADLISNKTITLASCKSDSLGNFSMEFDLFSTIEAEIFLNFCSNTIFLEPGENYILQFDSFLSRTNGKIPIGRCTPFYKLIEPNSNHELNSKIWLFNKVIDSTIVKSTQNNTISPNIKSNIKKTVSNFCKSLPDSTFLMKYIEYSTAEILSIFSRNRNIAIYNSILKKGINEELNPAFRSLFKSLFANYIFGSRTIPLTEIQKAIMLEKSRILLLDILEQTVC